MIKNIMVFALLSIFMIAAVPKAFAHDPASLVTGNDYYYYCPESKKINTRNDSNHAIRCFSLIQGFFSGELTAQIMPSTISHKFHKFHKFVSCNMQMSDYPRSQINDELLHYLHNNPSVRSFPVGMLIQHTSVGQDYIKCYKYANERASLFTGNDYYHYCPKSKEIKTRVDSNHAIRCFSYIQGFLVKYILAINGANNKVSRCLQKTSDYTLEQTNDELLNYLHNHPRKRYQPVAILMDNTSLGRSREECLKYAVEMYHKTNK